MVIMSFMVLGIVSLTRLGIDLFPEVNFPFVNISVVYPGASPEEVETLVTMLRQIPSAMCGACAAEADRADLKGTELKIVDVGGQYDDIQYLAGKSRARLQRSEACIVPRALHCITLRLTPGKRPVARSGCAS